MSDNLFEKNKIAVIYATYKQGLWGLDDPRDYINLMYYLQEHGRKYLDSKDAVKIISQIETIVEYTRKGKFKNAFQEMESLMGSVERTCPSIFDAIKDNRRKYAKCMRVLFGTKWKQHVGGGADYSTYSGNEFVDMLGLGPEDFGY